MSYLLEAHLAHLAAASMSPLTIGLRRFVLSRLHEALPHGLLYASTEQLEAWLSNRDWKPRTRRSYHSHMRAFYSWATKAGYLDGDPTAEILRPKDTRPYPRPIPEEDLALALTAPEPFRTATLLGAFAGLRASEAAACCREHITEVSLWIPRAKGGGEGAVPTHPILWEHVAGLPPGPLIVTWSGRQATGKWVSQETSRLWRRLGIKEATFHWLRHWCGTSVQREQGDIRVTQEVLRHASVASTQMYTQVTPGRLRAAVAALSLPGARTRQLLTGRS